jgi:hypothetical protein
VLTTVAKPRRNDPCPCGSGKKYKKCCLAKDEAQKRDELAKEQVRREERLRLDVDQMKAALAESLARAWHGDDDLAAASHAVVELVQAGELDGAEAAACDLIAQYPDWPDGWDCLGIVHEARCENRQAADCYRKMVDIMRQRPDDYDSRFESECAALIAMLDPPTAP